jgi:hypothetical protein
MELRPNKHLHSIQRVNVQVKLRPSKRRDESGQRAIEVYEAAALFDSLDEVEVLEDGKRLEAADRFVHGAADKDSGVAVHRPSLRSYGYARVKNRAGRVPPSNTRAKFPPATYVARGCQRAGVQLDATSALARDRSRAVGFGDRHGGIRATSVHDHHFAEAPDAGQGIERVTDRALFVQCRNHHRDGASKLHVAQP